MKSAESQLSSLSRAEAGIVATRDSEKSTSMQKHNLHFFQAGASANFKSFNVFLHGKIY
jgi:hypothetical protein